MALSQKAWERQHIQVAFVALSMKSAQRLGSVHKEPNADRVIQRLNG